MVRRRATYLASADLVKRNKGKGLGEHGSRQITLGGSEGDEHAGEEELWEEGDGFDAHRWRGYSAGGGGGQVELRVVGAEVMAVVDARYVVQVGVLEEGGAVAGARVVSWEEHGWR